MLGIAADTVESLRELLWRGQRADMIVTTGGVSMGDYDVVKNILAHDGDVSFWSIDMRPGKPVAFGTLLDVPFIGLPGNPVSTMVGFEILVRPALLTLAGHTRAGQDGHSGPGGASHLQTAAAAKTICALS